MVKNAVNFLFPLFLERDRLGREQEGSRFFEKKRRKKLLALWDCGAETSMAPFNKVFCFFFSKKKPSSLLRHDLP
jgi:hypothetical protein